MLKDVLSKELAEVVIADADLEKFEEELAWAGAGLGNKDSGSCEGKCSSQA